MPSQTKNHQGPIQFQIFGERNSGTSFITQLILQNVKNLKLTTRFGWKHGLTNGVEPPDRQNARVFPVTGKHHRTLFVVVVRNPYDWIRSMYKQPWHVHTLNGVPFSQFIRHPPTTHRGPPFRKGSRYPVYDKDLDPVTRNVYDNFWHMRNTKYREWLGLEKKVQHFLFVNYDEVCKNPQKFIKNITKTGKLRPRKHYTPILTYKGQKNSHRFKKRVYTSTTPADINFITSQLDAEQERKMGFDIQP